MNIALIGLGHWGSRLVPKLLDHAEVTSLHCCDSDGARSQKIARDFPEVEVTLNYESILADPGIEAVIIATPVASHYPLAKRALEQKKHVLLEKPLTNHVDNAMDLVALASAQGLKFMVDHITVYSGAAQSIKKTIGSNILGKLLYFDAVRANLGLIQSDVSVVWDLAIHEFALIDYLIGEMPDAVSASGAAFYGSLAEIADVTLFFKSGIFAHVYVSWLAPVKKRELIVAGTKKMLVFDDMATDDKLRLLDRGVDLTANAGVDDEPAVRYRDGDCQVLEYERTEPLVAVIDEFIRSISEDREPLTSGAVGARCVRILEAAERSVKQNGVCVNLD
jgi:predicted dehydrogenase